MAYCYSCGVEIPEGQGHSCSMCYGDPFWGRDGYCLNWLETQNQEALDESDALMEIEFETLYKKEMLE